MVEYVECPFCGKKNITKTVDYDRDTVFIECEDCGRVKYGLSALETIKKCKNEIATYLFYHKNKYKDYRSFFYIASSKDDVDDYEWAHTITKDEILSFCNCTFSEKIVQILLYLSKKSEHFSSVVKFNSNEYKSLLFLKRYNNNGDLLGRGQIRDQEQFFEEYLTKYNYIQFFEYTDKCISIRLLVEGWKRVDEIQKSASDSKNVFVAMSFANEMDSVREAIKEAIIECGFNPRIMDEIEYNHLIVPEMLYEIRQAKFVIAELTGHNNGAYYEAGYALGQGKEVIQLCKEETFGTDGHFDVQQINTICWKDEEDLKLRLVNRIKATIG